MWFIYDPVNVYTKRTGSEIITPHWMENQGEILESEGGFRNYEQGALDRSRGARTFYLGEGQKSTGWGGRK